MRLRKVGKLPDEELAAIYSVLAQTVGTYQHVVEVSPGPHSDDEQQGRQTDSRIGADASTTLRGRTRAYC